MDATALPQRYTPTAQFLHWLSAFLVLAAFLLGLFGDDFPKDSHALVRFVHILLGEGVVLLLLLRLRWRRFAPPAESGPIWLSRAATTSHYALYALLAATPVAGLVTQFAGGHALSVFGLFDISSPWIKDKAFEHDAKEVHELLAYGLMIVAVAHALAALGHRFYLKDATLARMTPRWLDRA